MEALSAVERIIRDLLVFVVAMSVVLAALMVIISRMPNDNPLKRIMMALSYRVAATAAAEMLVIPTTLVPRPRCYCRFRDAARPPLILVDLLPRRAPRPAGETSAVRLVRPNGLVIHTLGQGRLDRAPLVFANAAGGDLRI